jgi:hypothetical protein
VKFPNTLTTDELVELYNEMTIAGYSFSTYTPTEEVREFMDDQTRGGTTLDRFRWILDRIDNFSVHDGDHNTDPVVKYRDTGERWEKL